MNNRTVLFRNLGTMDYKTAWDLQETLLQQGVAQKMDAKNKDAATANESYVIKNYLLFVEHPPVYTLGKSGKMEHVLLSEAEIAEKQIGFFKINRGGDITFHGPGQIVGYPIFDLEQFYTDIGRYLRGLEEVIIRTLAGYGIKAGRSAGETGVWIDAEVPGRERKICAMGVRCSRWITMHGFAFNINTDLDYFKHIVPCGIQNKSVTSLQQELGRQVPLAEVQEKLLLHFRDVFGVEIKG
jgi:lipoyl(octanoyl) transferase